MLTKILIIGGYGNFGSFITKQLAMDSKIQVIIAGRSYDKAALLCESIDAIHKPEIIALDITADFKTSLADIKPDIVIHTSGPFQQQSYHVANCCIEVGAHYIDLADSREFVTNITNLHDKASDKDVVVISGASSVPCLTSAIVDYYSPEFDELSSVDCGITTAQKTSRGAATTAAIFSYTGRPFTTLVNGELHTIYGWQNIHRHNFPHLGNRFLGNCDIPDLNLFPKRYKGIKTIRFYAGIEIPFIHITLWLLSWGVRFGLIKHLEKAAKLLTKISFLFDRFGSDTSAFYMTLAGKISGKPASITFDLTARSGDGPYIPCMPAIILAKKLAHGEIDKRGAFPCMGLIKLNEYLESLKLLDITWQKKSD